MDSDSNHRWLVSPAVEQPKQENGSYAEGTEFRTFVAADRTIEVT